MPSPGAEAREWALPLWRRAAGKAGSFAQQAAEILEAAPPALRPAAFIPYFLMNLPNAAQALRNLEEKGLSTRFLRPDEAAQARLSTPEGYVAPRADPLYEVAQIALGLQGVPATAAAGKGAAQIATLGMRTTPQAMGRVPAVNPIEMLQGNQLGAVKLPGGAWNPEAVKTLSLAVQRGHLDPINELIPPPGGEGGIGGWADRAVRNYLNKYAGTERDPLKDVEIPFREGTKRWEDVTDDVFGARERWLSETRGIGTEAALKYRDKLREEGADPYEPTWAIEGPSNTISGLPPDYPYPKALRGFRELDTKTHVQSEAALKSYLSHVGDYLSQNVPPERLAKYDLVRAVRETAANDARVARQMERAQASDMASLPVYKAYDDGFRWVELKLPEKLTPEQARGVRRANEKEVLQSILPEEMDRPDFKAEGYIAVDPAGKPLVNNYTKRTAVGSTPEEAWLAGQLAKEGNAMGHCVGGYCPEVASGQSRIFSLRDPKGQSHATVEVEPASTRQGFSVPQGQEDHPVLANLGSNAKDNILQIKGKGNRAPIKEYLPYVQDFVRSGKWGEVGDFGNAGLVLTKDGRYVLPDEVKPGESIYLSGGYPE